MLCPAHRITGVHEHSPVERCKSLPRPEAACPVILTWWRAVPWGYIPELRGPKVWSQGWAGRQSPGPGRGCAQGFALPPRGPQRGTGAQRGSALPPAPLLAWLLHTQEKFHNQIVSTSFSINLHLYTLQIGLNSNQLFHFNKAVAVSALWVFPELSAHSGPSLSSQAASL